MSVEQILGISILSLSLLQMMRLVIQCRKLPERLPMKKTLEQLEQERIEMLKRAQDSNLRFFRGEKVPHLHQTVTVRVPYTHEERVVNGRLVPCNIL